MELLQILKNIFKKVILTLRKTSSIIFLMIMPAGLFLLAENPGNYTETIQKTAYFQNPSYPGNSLKVYNISGNVTVEQHSGEAVEITVEKRISADRQSDLERGIEELKFVVDEERDRILIYLDAPYIQINKRGKGINYNMNINRKETGYDFHFNITVKVPRNTNVYASTINNGDVRVHKVESREITAVNVNGNIDLNEISGKAKATTVNGNIVASYSNSPDTDTNYKTVNGTIEVSYPGDLSADLHFSSLRGDLYTDFENVHRTGAQVETNVSSGSGTRYRLSNSAPFRIGEGGPELRFNVLNGNVYIKKIES